MGRINSTKYFYKSENAEGFSERVNGTVIKCNTKIEPGMYKVKFKTDPNYRPKTSKQSSDKEYTVEDASYYENEYEW